MDTKAKGEGIWKNGKLEGSTYLEHLKVTPLTQGDWLVQDILGFNAGKKEIIIGSNGNISAANQSVQPQRQNWKAYITGRKRRYAPGFSL